MISDNLERQLREGLHQEAERISPRERRTEILAMIHDEIQVTEHHRRWLAPVAAAASVALIGAIAWGVSTNGGGDGGQALTPAVTATTTGPSADPNVALPNPPPPANSDGTAAIATTKVTLPAYFVGANSQAGTRFGLYREFVRGTVPVGATPAQKARAAVAAAMNAQPLTNFEPYVQPWSGTTVQKLTLTTSRITITLSGPGARGFTAEQTRLAVQELVWTSQAAIGKGPIPVRFVIATGATKLFGIYPTSRNYNRPAKDREYTVLAPIWITTPVRAQSFRAGVTVVARGQSCAFEATTQWQLKKSGKTVKSGFTTATSGCPTRGTWQVSLGKLAAGSYTFRMYEASMEGSRGPVADTSKPFTVK